MLLLVCWLHILHQHPVRVLGKNEAPERSLDRLAVHTKKVVTGPALIAAMDADDANAKPIDKAADWVAETLTKIAAVPDRASLAELQQASAKASAKLSDQRPELSSMLSNAFLARMDSFADVAAPETDNEAPF